MKHASLALLTLLIQLAWPAGAQSSDPDAGGDSECSRADAEVAFVRGLSAFHNEKPEQAATDLDQAESYFARAVRCDAGHGSALYWLGVTHLLQGKPHDAVAAISKSLKTRAPVRADRWRILAHLGAAHLQAGDERAASRSLGAARGSLPKVRTGAQAEGWNESDILALRLLGRSLRSLGRHRESQEVLARVQGLKPEDAGTEVTVALPRYRGPFWPPKSPWRWDGRLGLDAGSDSNPNLLDDELTLSTLDGELVRGDEPDEVLGLDVRLALYRISEEDHQTATWNGWSLGLTFHGRQSVHREFDFLDLGQSRAVVQLAWGRDPLSHLSGPLGYTRVPYGASRVSVLLQAGYIYTQLDGETYFQGAGTALSMTFRETRFMDTQVELTYQDLDFGAPLFENRGRSGNLRAVDVSQFFYLKQRNRYLSLGLVAGERDADLAYSRFFFAAHAEAALPLRPKWSLLLTGSVRREDFDHPESNLFLPTDTKPREDTTMRATATLIWLIASRLKLFASLGYVDRDSKLDLPPDLSGLDYKRTRGLLGLKWFFGSGN